MEVGIYTFAKKHYRNIEKCGSSMIRGQWLVDHWPEAELYREGKKYDVIIFQKVWLEELYDGFDGIKILDLCDPEWIQSNWPIKKIAKKVDAITVSSKGLYDELKKIVDCEVIWIDDRVNLDYVGGHKKKHIAGRAETVGWFGYSGNGFNVLDPVKGHIYTEQLKLNVISDKEIRFPTINSQTKFKEFSWDKLIFDLLECDFILNPPLNNSFGKYKSLNKTYLAWALGIPVAHNIGEFKEFIDGDKRKLAGESVYNIVRKDFDIKQSVKQYQELIKKICNNKK